jgi:membrane-bound ClpP family serine protease
MKNKSNEQKQPNNASTDPLLVTGIALVPVGIALMNTEAKAAGYVFLFFAAAMMIVSVAKQAKKK